MKRAQTRRAGTKPVQKKPIQTRAAASPRAASRGTEKRGRSKRTPKRTPGEPPKQTLLGAHQSIAGGLSKAVDRATETGCLCLQIFTRNINRWDVSPIDPEEAARFRAAVAESELGLVVAHDSYLINPASADDLLRDRSIAGLVTELERADLLGIPWVVAHPGAAGEQPLKTALLRAADGITAALAATKRLASGILVETTAGQGSCLGASFEEIAVLLERIDRRPDFSARVGVCLDTCHVFAAGYQLAPADALDATLRQFDRLIGIGRLKLIHANDSKRERGSRVDRHEEIGKGRIGREAFGLIMNHPMLAGIPMILETPKEGSDGKPTPVNDRRNLAALRGLVRPGR